MIDFYHNYSASDLHSLTCSVISNCLECTDGPQCTVCDAGYILTDAAPDNSCIQCPSGYWPEFPMQCSSCPAGSNC